MNLRFLRCKGSYFASNFSINSPKKHIILLLLPNFLKSVTFCKKKKHFSLQIIDPSVSVATPHPPSQPQQG